MPTRATAGRRLVAAALVAALLTVACPARAAEPSEQNGGTSKIQWVVRGAFVLGAAVILFVIIRAAFSKSDDTSRLGAATAKLDRALGLTSTAGANRAGADVGLRRGRSWLLPGALADAPTPPP